LLGSSDFVANTLPRLGRQVQSVHVLEMIGFRCDPHSGPGDPRRAANPAARPSLPLPWVPDRLRWNDYLALITKGRSNGISDRAMASRAAPDLGLVTVKTWGPMHTVVPALTRSDHFAFWTAGLAATLWTDLGPFRNPHYHASSDTPDTLDYGFMRDTAELLCALAGATQPAAR
jgi:hypothetical protein